MEDKLYLVESFGDKAVIGKMNSLEKWTGILTRVLHIRDCVRIEEGLFRKNHIPKAHSSPLSLDKSYLLKTHQEASFREPVTYVLGSMIINPIEEEN